MLPIKISLHENPIFVSSEDDIVEGYEFKNFSNFFPEFLEEVYDEGNRELLKSGNNELLYHLNNKNSGKYQYIATWKKNIGKETYYTEYYYDNGGDIICFLIIDPNDKRYYTRLQAIATYEKESEVA